MARRKRGGGSYILTAGGGKRGKTRVSSVSTYARSFGFSATDPAVGIDPRLGKVMRAKRQARHPKGTRRGGQFR